MSDLLHSDTLKVFGIQAGGFGVWWIDWLPFFLQITISVLTIIFMFYKIKIIRKQTDV